MRDRPAQSDTVHQLTVLTLSSRRRTSCLPCSTEQPCQLAVYLAGHPNDSESYHKIHSSMYI